MNYKEAYKIFDLNVVMCKEGIKSRYKRLTIENHPDRFMRKKESVIKQQSEKMLLLNEAYATLLHYVDGSSSENCDDILFNAFSFDINISNDISGRTKKIHPHHKDQRYRFLWHTIKGISKVNQGLALRCWEKAIFQLLEDYDQYPDIDGIIHNYIRDCSALLFRLGLFTRAFKLIEIVVKANARSYYSFYPPSELVWKNILKSSKYSYSIKLWEDVFLGKYLFKDIRVTWAMMLSYYLNAQPQALLDHIENELILLLKTDKLYIKEWDMNEEYSIAKTTHSLTVMGTPKGAHISISSSHLEIMQEDIKCMLINALVQTKALTPDKKCDLRQTYPKIASIIGFYAYDSKQVSEAYNHTIDRKNSGTSFGMNIMKTPIMEYTKEDVNQIWAQHFPQKRITDNRKKEKVLN